MTTQNTPSLLKGDNRWTCGCQGFTTIETLTLAQGFTLQHRAALKEAVSLVVVENPILMGRATFEDDKFSIVPDAFPVDKHSFYEEIDLSTKVPPSFHFTDSNQHENFRFMEKIILPNCKNGTTKSEFEPLFSFTVFLLKKNIICYKMSMAHIIGDTSTYNALMDQINSVLENEPLNSINWNNHMARSSPISNRCSGRYKYPLFGLVPLIVGLLRKLHQKVTFRRYNHFVIDQTTVEEKKLSLVDRSQHDFLSTNDIIMAALCQVNPKVTLVSMVMNCRGRTQGIDSRDGGNFTQMAWLDVEAGKDPNTIRDAVKRGGQFLEPNQAVLRPYLEGKFWYVTNWATLTTFLNPNGVKTLSNMPIPGKCKTDTCIIFKATESCTAISCNFPIRKVFDEGPSLQHIFIPDQARNTSIASNYFRTNAAEVICFVAVIIGLLTIDTTECTDMMAI